MDVQIGERWAHRRRKNDTPAEVEVLRIGTRQPPKVFVRFVDDEYESREEWCSVRSLKVLWPEMPAFLALEQKWVDVRKASPPEHDLEVQAASIVVSEVDGPILGGWGRSAGLLHLYLDEPMPPGWELDLKWFLDHDGFVDDDEAIAPWPALLEAAMHLAQRFGEPVLAHLENVERENEHGAVYGEQRETLDRGGRPYFMPPNTSASRSSRRHQSKHWSGNGAARRRSRSSASSNGSERSYRR